jgi:stress-induced-phosphoprotein 1
MADTLAFRAKEEGSKAWVEGNYSKALEGFSEAINHGGDKDFLKVIYSNRSAVYLKLNKPEDALKDGNKAIELDANWPKGYTRKGDALYQLKRFTDAYNAYNSGVRVAPNDAGLKEKAELAMKALRNEASRSSSSSSASSASSSSSSAPQSAPATGIVRQGKLAVVLLILLYFVPFLGSINTMAYRYLSFILFVRRCLTVST